MNLFTNLDFLSVGIVIAATGVLAVVVFFNNTKSVTGRAFGFFSLMTIAWGTLNYVNYKLPDPILAFWILRLGVFFAVWHSFSLILLLYVFPEDHKILPKWMKKFSVPLTTLAAILTLTPLVFNKILELGEDGRILRISNGPGIAVFGLVVVCNVILAIILFAKKMRRGQDLVKKQQRTILIGIVLTFSLILIFNFIYPAFLNNSNFIPFGALFIFPLIAFTSFAIMRYGLFSVKVVSTEILVFVLAIVSLVDAIISENIFVLVFRSSIFLLVLTIGVLLIRSVIKEVKQREELQILTKQLGEANTQLQALDKARAEFISIASHQLRTPPATIKWYVGAIMDGDFGPLSDELKASLQRVESTNNSQISLIDDLLNASRIERGKLEFFFEMGDVEPLAKITYEQLIPQAKMHKLELKYEPPTKPLPKVMLDKEKVRQVINNFIDNALKYTKQGSVTVHFDQTDKDVIVKVTDTGRGVAPDVAPTLFSKYTRGKDAASAASGLGLGLYVAKVVIEQNNGKIWVESPGEGKGSTFAFSLPIKNTLHETSSIDLSKDQPITGSIEATTPKV